MAVAERNGAFHHGLRVSVRYPECAEAETRDADSLSLDHFPVGIPFIIVRRHKRVRYLDRVAAPRRTRAGKATTGTTP
jgi:hypothetical protein